MVETELLKIIIEYAKNHKEGFTAWLSDYSLIDDKTLIGRYVVAFDTVITLNEDLTPLVIYPEKIKPYRYYGGWHDNENKVYLIEKILIFEVLENALLFAQANNQRFIYDLLTKKSVEVI